MKGKINICLGLEILVDVLSLVNGGENVNYPQNLWISLEEF